MAALTMPRTVDDPAPIPSRQGLVGISTVQARYHGGARSGPITHGIIHMTAGGSLLSSESWANRPNCPPAERVSWHLGIERFGQMRRFCAYDYRAFHAGRSAWPGARVVGGSLNDCAIGIELANWNGAQDGSRPEPVGREQYLSAVWAAAVLCERFGFPAGHWLGHREVSPGRKSDPDARVFDMDAFRVDVAAELVKRQRARAA